MPVEKLRQMVIQDNNPFGDNDWDVLSTEWDGEELNDWGFDVWKERERDKPAPKREKEETGERQDKADFFDMMLGDRIYDSNNDFDIPNLRPDYLPEFCG